MKYLIACIFCFTAVLIIDPLLRAGVPAIHYDNADYQLNIVEANIPQLKATIFNGRHALSRIAL